MQGWATVNDFRTSVTEAQWQLSRGTCARERWPMSSWRPGSGLVREQTRVCRPCFAQHNILKQVVLCAFVCLFVSLLCFVLLCLFVYVCVCGVAEYPATIQLQGAGAPWQVSCQRRHLPSVVILRLIIPAYLRNSRDSKSFWPAVSLAVCASC